MTSIKITVNDEQVKSLGKNLRTGIEVGLLRVAERGEQILRDKVPKVTRNLMQGVSSDVDRKNLEAKLLIAARTGLQGPQTGLLHLPGGGTREIPLRGKPRFDYAEAVATGTGVYGPKGTVIRPRKGKALLIAVDNVKAGKAYIEAGGQKFVVRRSARGRRPNPYDVRTAQRLEKEAEPIFSRAIDDVVNEARTR